MRRILSLLAVFAIVVSVLCGCEIAEKLGFGGEKFDPTTKSYVPHEEIYTTGEGVYITLDSVEFVDGQPVFNVDWHNETDRLICFGVGYRIEIKNGENWESRMVEDFPIIEIACMLYPGETGRQVYKGQFFDFSDNGTYRLFVEFYFSDEQGGGGTSYTCFEVADK